MAGLAATSVGGSTGGTLVLRVTPTTALLGSCALSFGFVASLHLWKLVGYRDENRDATGTIQRRFISTVVTSLLGAALIYALAEQVESGAGYSFGELVGISALGHGWPCLSCLLLTASLFIGPLVQHAVAVQVGAARLFSLPGGTRWIAFRNLVLAPASEEFVFRACIVRLWVGASLPLGATVFLSPLCFALAHTHHFVEHVRSCGNKQAALLQVAFQVFYTSLFGMYSTFLLLRVGSAAPVIVAHSFCNHQGFPDISFMLSKANPLHKHRAWLGALYLLGVLAFSRLLWPLTEGFASPFRSGGVAL